MPQHRTHRILQDRCSTCGARKPEFHPRDQFGFKLCTDPFHMVITPTNSPFNVSRVKRKLARQAQRRARHITRLHA